MANIINGTVDPETLNGTIADDQIFGFAGADTINGLGGNDTIDAGDGDDTVTIDSGIDTADGGANNDTLRIDYSAAGLTGTLTIDLRNMIGDGAGTIKYGTLTGHLTHFENITLLNGSAVKDTIFMGSNFVDSTINLYLGDDKFYGGDWADHVSGGGGNDTLFGGGGGDVLSGDGGNDILNGGEGSDNMYGGAGNDSYYVDDLGDFVSETTDSNTNAGGTDIVRSSVDFALGAYIENLNLIGTEVISGFGNGLANIINGNSAENLIEGYGGNDTLNGLGGDDSIYGGGGNDIINGGVGDDSMYGGSGNDIYTVDSLLDYVGETVGEGSDAGGTDLVKSSVSFELGSYVEKLTLTGIVAIDGTGNNLANTLNGNGAANGLYGLGGKDTINGGSGADTVSGGSGADILTGGGGHDIFLFDVMETSANRDTIKDFSLVMDAIAFNGDLFTALTHDAEGKLDAGQFAIGPAASTSGQHLIYNTTNHVLYYDADGSGIDAQVAVANIANSVDLSTATFLVV